MPASRCWLHFVPALALALTLTLTLMSSFAAAQQSDQAVAERALGPQWKQFSRRAGMIFAGTVLAPAIRPASNQTGTTDRSELRTSAGTAPGATTAVHLSFRVDEAIAGVEQGGILTIHEWTGAGDRLRPVSTGQHFLIFLYPSSRLGLTSPVGGALGQIALDASGQNVRAVPVSMVSSDAKQPDAAATNISIVQLERAIRSARGE
jgi:hypothetical protein